MLTCVVVTSWYVVAVVSYFTSIPATSSVGGWMSLSIYLLYLIFCVFTYCMIFTKIIMPRRNTQTEASEATNSFSFICSYLREHGFFVPALITFTYVILIAVPSITLIACADQSCAGKAFQVWSITYILNNISDALIYVFCDRDIVSYLRNKFARRTHQRSNEVELQPSVIITS